MYLNNLQYKDSQPFLSLFATQLVKIVLSTFLKSISKFNVLSNKIIYLIVNNIVDNSIFLLEFGRFHHRFKTI